MKRIIIIGEGQTEQLFCNDILQPHFSLKNIYIQNPIIKKTRGGIVNWSALKHQIENHLKQDVTATVTTFIDYYGLQKHHKLPDWSEAEKKEDKEDCMSTLENGMFEDIDKVLRQRFVPYIQLHEFEGLLFSEKDVYDKIFEPHEFADYKYLEETIDLNPNPELINNGETTAPSKRLQRILKEYPKVIYGSLLATDIGLTKIRSKCPRFNSWITKLESL